MRLIAIVFCLFTAYSGFTQVPLKFRRSSKPYKYYDSRLLFKIAPLALIDEIEFPAIQGGLEIALSNKMSWYNEFGFRYRKALYENDDTGFVARRGYRIKSEVRYYFKDPDSKIGGRLTGYYLAVNLFYIKNVDNKYVGYYYQKDTSAFTQDDFGMTKKVLGGNFIIGNQMYLGKRFLFECYGGLGLRLRDIVTVGREFDHERDRESRGHHWTFTDLTGGRPELKDGKTTTINISIGVRFAYRLF
ncbi:hypothetical protein [Niastella sp. OAS944]|uniref:hypothetical protein n=1 Tax=Niastella sp. OAS944 TaxID=2664089 RepID=UPI003477D774|nr:hypothetical protein [Chitinophagaceae bacterium OAS944]